MPKGYQLWFLRDLMIIFLFTPQLYLLLKRRKPYVLLILVLLYLLPFPHGWNLVFSKFPTALLFFSIGAYMGIHKQNMVKIARNIPLWLSISITVIALVFHVWQCTIQGQHEFLAQKIYALVSVVPTIQLASLLVERRQLKPRAFIADSNFLLFMIHPPLMHYLVVETLTGKLSNTPFHFWLAYTTELLVPVVGCIILYAIMHRLIPKTTSFLTGGRS